MAARSEWRHDLEALDLEAQFRSHRVPAYSPRPTPQPTLPQHFTMNNTSIPVEIRDTEFDAAIQSQADSGASTAAPAFASALLVARSNNSAAPKSTPDAVTFRQHRATSLPDTQHRLQSHCAQPLGRYQLNHPVRFDARKMRAMQHLQAVARAAMTRKWLHSQHLMSRRLW